MKDVTAAEFDLIFELLRSMGAYQSTHGRAFLCKMVFEQIGMDRPFPIVITSSEARVHVFSRLHPLTGLLVMCYFHTFFYDTVIAIIEGISAAGILAAPMKPTGNLIRKCLP
uniref:Uncharacterized protein n=1 Tax=Parascaris equorum TaxID=6256 RepID=A0A914RRK9_PAREQ